MSKKIIAIVPAAGLGKRFGKESNKQFQPLGDKPLIVWPLEVLESIDDITEIIPVLKKEDMELGLELIEKYKFSKVKKIAPGGKERQDSVYEGLTLIEKTADIVLIHDGVRPLVGRDLIESAIQELSSPYTPPSAKRVKKEDKEDADGVIAGVPLKDTVKEVCRAGGTQPLHIVKKTLDRNVIWAIQTPQVFKYKILMSAYKKAMTEGYYSTDDSAIIERYGGKVKIIMGSYINIKITTPEDLIIAELFLKQRKNNSTPSPHVGKG